MNNNLKVEIMNEMDHQFICNVNKELWLQQTSIKSNDNKTKMHFDRMDLSFQSQDSYKLDQMNIKGFHKALNLV